MSYSTSLSATIATLQTLEEREKQGARRRLREYASQFHLRLPHRSPSAVDIDVQLASVLTALVHRSKLSLVDFVRIFRNQSTADSRPNKALFELPVPHNSKRADAYVRWNQIVREGVRPRWKTTKPVRQSTRPVNHKSAAAYATGIRRHIRKGQRDGRFLVLHESVLDIWPEVFVSPIGVIEKGIDDTRLINDYSYPTGCSVNEFTEDGDFPSISYNPPGDIARRINALRLAHPNDEVLLMLGDVSSAFRHVPINEIAVHMFAFIFDGYVVIDLACGFGWCGSPAYYSLAGTVINDLYESSYPTNAPKDASNFTGNVWCDDHTCIEVNTGSRCHDANVALRRAMATVLGSSAINDKKFTEWKTLNKALGLMWNTSNGTVSIPLDKLKKAEDRVSNLLACGTATKRDLNRTLGVMRHVATCFPPARAFYQRLHSAALYTLPFTARLLLPDELDDLRWFLAVLHRKERFNGIPVAQFANVAIPTIHLYMDACDDGLCVLEPQRSEFIRVRFSSIERNNLKLSGASNSINIRELQSAVLAALIWGPTWCRSDSNAPVHVRLHIDNMSAVAWSSRRLSRHPTAQLYNRLLSLAELQYNLSITSEHIPGKLNIMADAGSRAWSGSSSRSTISAQFGNSTAR